ncbi:signal peptidase II [Burkholderiaceae bacterium FT117]|uniref:signal peptidase II n=1 Tax=Zeimonas sediminis TaxID=2944268 RepID=UPI002342C48F|nr:signal peptidase II [Zeimonas sediminis]MCM5572250.1 signal peptidase II [Zeimonas sediminis]
MASRGAPNRLGRHLGLAAALIALDQLTKWIAVRALDFGERVPVIPGFFDFTLVYNRGAAFSFLAGAGGWQRWFFTGIGIAAAVFIVWMLARHGSQRLFAFALSLILAGAIGNVIDRVWQGKVTDFVLLYWRDWHWPAFNVADMAITFGAALLILDEILRVRRAR